MDQRSTTEADLYERLFPGRPLPYWLGEALRYPVRDIPTLEDYEREQGLIGVPTEEQSSREVGQGALDYLSMAHSIASLLKSGTGTAQELMGKRRGQETFGKEIMDTSRLAQPGFQRKATAAERDLPLTVSSEQLAGLREVMQGRKSYRDMLHERDTPYPSLPPQGTPTFQPGQRLPSDVVRRDTGGARMGLPEAYTIGEPIVLPGGRTAQYMVIPRGNGGSVVLDYGERPKSIYTSLSLGEALAKARQLQNRLALAAKDPALQRDFSVWSSKPPPERDLRLPWERGTSGWNIGYSEPPRSGRWSPWPWETPRE